MAYIGKNPKWNTSTHTPQSADPSNPTEGMVFYSDGTPRAEGLWIYTNGAFVLVSSGETQSVVSKTANYTATSTDDIILCDSSGGAFTITLPAASGLDGKIFTIKKTDSTETIAVTIDGNASETIDGDTTKTLITENESIKIACDGTNWQVLERNIPSVWKSYTATGSWTTNTTYSDAYYRRVGDNVEVKGKLALSGVPNSANLTINMPISLTIDATKTSNEILETPFGLVGYRDATDGRGGGHVVGSASTSLVRLATTKVNENPGNSIRQISISDPISWNSGDLIEWNFSVPVEEFDI